MAIFNIKYDSTSKSCEVDIDGETVEDVTHIMIEKGYNSDGGHLEIARHMKDMQNGIMRVERIMANAEYPEGYDSKTKKRRKKKMTKHDNTVAVYDESIDLVEQAFNFMNTKKVV